MKFSSEVPQELEEAEDPEVQIVLLIAPKQKVREELDGLELCFSGNMPVLRARGNYHPVVPRQKNSIVN